MADKKIPLGQPLELSDEELDQLAQVTPTDLKKAQLLWWTYAPIEFNSLLDAQTIEEDEEPRP